MAMLSEDSAADALDRLFARRAEPVGQMLTDAEPLARTCRAMAGRFQRGGKLIVFGNGGPSTDAQHVAVEFVHPVIVGKRALPALSLTSDVATLTGVASGQGLDEVFAHQIRHLADPEDIALGISTDGHCRNVLHGLLESGQRRMLTVGLVGGSGGAISDAGLDHILLARANDSRVVKEMHVTMYHILWELVHVFLGGPSELTGSYQ